MKRKPERLAAKEELILSGSFGRFSVEKSRAPAFVVGPPIYAGQLKKGN
jgi:hypothetical protein